MPEQSAQKPGRIIEIKGVVIDVVFPEGLPEINTALRIEVPAQDGEGSRSLIAEVQQHLGDDRVRAVAMDSTTVSRAGSRCATRAADLGAGRATRRSAHLERDRRAGRRTARAEGRRALVDPPRPPAFTDLSPKIEVVRDGHQGDRPARAVHPRRQGRPLRRRRSRQDGADPGADPQRRARARRRLRLRRRRRAHARGQRPLLEMQESKVLDKVALVYGR
jgi:hypothetical protein